MRTKILRGVKKLSKIVVFPKMKLFFLNFPRPNKALNQKKITRERESESESEREREEYREKGRERQKQK